MIKLTKFEQTAIDLCEERGFVNKREFIQNLTDEEWEDGLIRVKIPDYDGIPEYLWVWISMEDRLKYLKENSNEIITGILCNTPLNFSGILCCFFEIEIQCRGKELPIISEEWVYKNILNADWYGIR